MKITADDLLGLGIIEKVIPEEKPACRENQRQICRMLRAEIRSFLVRFQDRQTVSFWITVTSVSAACNECRNREGKN